MSSPSATIPTVRDRSSPAFSGASPTPSTAKSSPAIAPSISTPASQPGRIYELVYTVKDPVVAGLGFAAVRDFAAWAKHPPLDNLTPAGVTVLAPLGDVQRVYALGISQCGRFLRDFLYQGFNQDEANRMALDGVLAHVGGAGRGSFNERFAQPSRDAQPTSSVDYPTDIFPFTDEPEPIPANPSAQPAGLLDRAKAEHDLPKIFLSHTSYEYWSRAASLITTTADGQRDMPIDPECPRVFLHRTPALLRDRSRRCVASATTRQSGPAKPARLSAGSGAP